MQEAKTITGKFYMQPPSIDIYIHNPYIYFNNKYKYKLFRYKFLISRFFTSTLIFKKSIQRLRLCISILCGAFSLVLQPLFWKELEGFPL